MALFSSHQPHAFVHGNTARSVIARGLGHLHDATPKRFEPVVVDDPASFTHVAVFLPCLRKPEATVVTRLIKEADASDDLPRLRLQADHPMPFTSGVHGG
ncbi:hypothetical protein D3C78_1689800 [compost metagenome]